MEFNRRVALNLVGLSLASTSTFAGVQPVFAQGGMLLQRLEQRRAAEQQTPSQPANQPPLGNSSDVSMVALKVEPGENGQQMVVTPKGLTVPLPGPGVTGPVVHVYMGGSGGYWYMDKNNQPVDLTPAVKMMQAGAMQSRTATAVPQYAPAPQVYVSQTAGSSGSTAATAAAAAGFGAMAGAAMASSSDWNTVPYGTPIRYGAGAVPYYNQGEKPVYINAANNEANAYHAAALEQQSNWYKQQQLEQGATWKAWQGQTVNPFINPGAAAYGATAAHYGAVEGQQAERYGAAAGATAAHYGAEQGQQAERYGAAAGATAAHYGAEQGQQAERYGATAGAAADRYGHNQGEEEARRGAAAGATADRYGHNQAEEEARRGAAAGASADHDEERRGEGRFGGGAGRGGRFRR